MSRSVYLGFALALAGLALWAAAPPAAPGSAETAGPPVDLRALSGSIDRVLAAVEARRLRSDRHTPWVVLHGVIAFEQDLVVFDAERGESLGAIDYLLTRAHHGGRPIFRDVDGVPTLPPRERFFQVQDHVDQLLMALADAGVAPDRPLVAEGGRRYTVWDLVVAAQKSFDEGQELGWTLVAMTHYVGLGSSWTPAAGARVAVEDLVRLAIARDPRRETEGGSHHLYGVAYALGRHRASARPDAGTWEEAARYLREYAELARRYQQPDGPFSAAIFRGSAAPRSPRQLVSTTGHTLEWLGLALPPDELREAWVRRAVTRLCTVMLELPLDRFSDGGIYHAAHALRIYREAVFPAPGSP